MQSGTQGLPPRAGIADWQALASSGADVVVNELLRRMEVLLSPEQRRAVFAWLPEAPELRAGFARSLGARVRGPLAGVPYFLKDLFALAGVPTRAGGALPVEVVPVPEADSELVRRLGDAGAVCAGKTHLHEFAYGLTGENPHYGNCENPAALGRTTGGSSSGSAAAVAAGVVPFAVGTDTGGSVRTPAAFCGLYGFRGVPGDRLIADAFSLSPSCDTAGWFTRSARDLLQVQAALGLAFEQEAPPRGLYLGSPLLEPELERAFSRNAALFASQADAQSAEQLATAFHGSARAYTVITSHEAYLQHRQWIDRYRGHYSPLVWQRIDRGRRWTETDHLAAASTRQFIRSTLASYFLSYDFLVLPATPCPALRHEDCATFDRERILELSAPASLAGLPVVSIPIQLESGLWSGLQIILPRTESPVTTWALKLATTSGLQAS